MADRNAPLTNTVEDWRQTYNLSAQEVGDK